MDTVGTWTNTASSDRTSSFPFDPDQTNNTASAAVTVSPQPADLSVTKAVSAAEVTVGESLTFTIVVSNAGPGPAQDVVLADSFPAGLTPTAVSDPSCAITGQDLSCQLGTLTVGAVRQITVTALTTTAGGFTNVALVSSSTPDPNPGTEVATAGGSVVDPAPPTTDTVPPGTLPATGSGSSGATSSSACSSSSAASPRS